MHTHDADLVVDLFAGPGGWDQGLRLAGYTSPLVGIEWDMSACRTATKAGHDRIRADVSTYPVEPFIGRVDGLVASPPCQGFSAAGDRRGGNDLPDVIKWATAYAHGEQPRDVRWCEERSRLTAEPMRWITALTPRWVTLEQVPPVLPLWQHFQVLLRAQGYAVWTGILAAERYGVPQTRRRAVLIARNDGRPVSQPTPTHQPYRKGRAPDTEADLLGAPLPPPVSMAQALGRVDELFAQWVLRSNYGTGGDSSDRGECGLDEPAATVTGKAGRNFLVLRNGNQANACERTADEPAGTLFFGGRTNAVDVIGPFGVSRRVTVQEAGILQSFPADYPWTGTKSSQYQQVGNAVPPLLASRIVAPLIARSASRRWVA